MKAKMKNQNDIEENIKSSKENGRRLQGFLSHFCLEICAFLHGFGLDAIMGVQVPTLYMEKARG